MKAKRRVTTAKDGRICTKRPPTVRRSKPLIGGGGPGHGAVGRQAPVTEAVARVSSGPAVAPGASVDLTVNLGRGLVLANPILVASGTFGYGIEYGDVVDVDRLGAICCKGTTLRPRVGNVTPRVTETPGGMLNSIGLQNPGVDAVVEKYAGTWTVYECRLADLPSAPRDIGT